MKKRIPVAVISLGFTLTHPLATAWECSMEKGGKPFEITYSQVVNLPVLKGGSDLFYFYMLQGLNFIHDSLKGDIEGMDPSYQKGMDYLCQDSGCNEGLDLSKLDAKAVSDLLTLLSWFDSTCSGGTRIGEKTVEAVAFLQGWLAPAGWNPYFSLSDSDEEESANSDLKNKIKAKQISRKHIRFVKGMETEGVTKVIVNLPDQFRHYQDIGPFVALGRTVKLKKMDLHIIRCGTYCANYLLPAARTVTLEPHGYIYTRGSATGAFNDTSLAVEEERRYRLKRLREDWLPQLQTPEIVSFVQTQMTRAVGFPPPPQKKLSRKARKEAFDSFEQSLAIWAETVWGADRWIHFQEAVHDYGSDFRKRFKDFDRDMINGFVESLNTDENRSFLKDLAVFFEWDRGGDKRGLFIISRYMFVFRSLMNLEKPYYGEIEAGKPPSQTDYNYMDFLNLAAYLVKDPRYEQLFSVPRNYYAVPESERPYDVIAPSPGLLRALGINVKGGENDQDRLDRDFKGRVLYLNDKRIQSCAFFKARKSYTEDTLEECLSRGE